MPSVESESTTSSLTENDVAAIDAWWRAANYLAVGQIVPYWIGRSLLDEVSASLGTGASAEEAKPETADHQG